MKKLLLILFAFITFNSFAQDEPKPITHVPFSSLSVGWNLTRCLTYSGEIGLWSVGDATTSYSLTFDATPVNDKISYCVGVKPYFTVFSNDKISYMFYFSPKVALASNTKPLGIIEVGFNPNYKLHKNWLLGVTVGNQSLQYSTFNPFISTGVVFLLN